MSGLSKKGVDPGQQGLQATEAADSEVAMNKILF